MYLYGPYPTAPKISTPDYIGTGDSHNPISSQSHRPIYLYLVGLMVIVRVSYRCGYSVSRVGLINNKTGINSRCVRSNSLCRKRLNERTGEMLIKNFMGAQLPFPFFFLPFSLLIFLLLLLPHLLPATAKESGGALQLPSENGRSRAAKRHLVNFGVKECF